MFLFAHACVGQSRMYPEAQCAVLFTKNEWNRRNCNQAYGLPKRVFFAHVLSKDYDNSRDWSALCFTEKINELKQTIIVFFFFFF